MVWGYPFEEKIISQGFKIFSYFRPDFFFPLYRCRDRKPYFSSLLFIWKRIYNEEYHKILTRRELYSNWHNKRVHFHIIILRAELRFKDERFEVLAL